MVKDKLDKKLIAAAALALVGAGVALFLLMPSGFSTMSFSGAAEAQPKPQLVEVPVPPSVHPAVVQSHSGDTRHKPKKPAHKVVDSAPVVQTPPVAVEAPKTAVERIEEKVRLKRPKNPDQVGEYLPLVYWACREISRIDKDRALDWVEEGLSFSRDASFSAYGAFIHYQQGRMGAAQTMAESALISPSILDKRSPALARAILTLLRSPNDSAARKTVASFEVHP